jgi:hypothetical protein
MVFPLFVMALVWDKARLRDRRWMSPKLVRVRLAGRTLVTNSLNIAVAVGFTVMGVAVILLAGSPDMTRGTEAQAAIGRGLSTVFSRFEDWSSPVPEPVGHPVRASTLQGRELARGRAHARRHP